MVSEVARGIELGLGHDYEWYNHRVTRILNKSAVISHCTWRNLFRYTIAQEEENRKAKGMEHERRSKMDHGPIWSHFTLGFHHHLHRSHSPSLPLSSESTTFVCNRHVARRRRNKPIDECRLTGTSQLVLRCVIHVKLISHLEFDICLPQLPACENRKP